MLENYNGKKIKRLPSIKDRMKGKELHSIFDVDDIFNINILDKSHEEIIINIMEKVKKIQNNMRIMEKLKFLMK